MYRKKDISWGKLFPSWQAGAPPADREKWFPQKPLFFSVIGLSFLYSALAAFNPALRSAMDVVLSPIVDALHWVGLGIVKPCMDGPLPARFYLNQIGIAIWGAVLYNLMTMAYLLLNRRPMSREPEKSIQRLMNLRQWGRVQAVIFLHLMVYLVNVLFAVYCTACLLNGVHGWFVFHVEEYSVASAMPLCFVLPGAMAGMMCLSVCEYLLYDGKSVIKLFLNLLKG